MWRQLFTEIYVVTTGLKNKVLNTVGHFYSSELHFAVVVPGVMVSTEYARSVLQIIFHSKKLYKM